MTCKDYPHYCRIDLAYERLRYFQLNNRLPKETNAAITYKLITLRSAIDLFDVWRKK